MPFPAGGSGVCDGFPGGQGLRVVVSFRDAGGRFLWPVVVCHEGGRAGVPGGERPVSAAGGLPEVVEGGGQALAHGRPRGGLRGSSFPAAGAVLSNEAALAEMLPDHEPLFVEAVKCLLASKVAATVTGKPQNVGVFLELYRGYVAYALYHDVSQRGSNDQHPLKDILDRSIL